MKRVKLLLPFDEVMGVIETYLYDRHFIHEDEHLMYADIGLPVNDKGFVELEVELQEFLSAPVNEIDFQPDLFKTRTMP